jgi:hypothetical protein
VALEAMGRRHRAPSLVLGMPMGRFVSGGAGNLLVVMLGVPGARSAYSSPSSIRQYLPKATATPNRYYSGAIRLLTDHANSILAK